MSSPTPSYHIVRLGMGLWSQRARGRTGLFLSKCVSPFPRRLLDQRSSGKAFSKPRSAKVLSRLCSCSLGIQHDHQRKVFMGQNNGLLHLGVDCLVSSEQCSFADNIVIVRMDEKFTYYMHLPHHYDPIDRIVRVCSSRRPPPTSTWHKVDMWKEDGTSMFPCTASQHTMI